MHRARVLGPAAVDEARLADAVGVQAFEVAERRPHAPDRPPIGGHPRAPRSGRGVEVAEGLVLRHQLRDRAGALEVGIQRAALLGRVVHGAWSCAATTLARWRRASPKLAATSRRASTSAVNEYLRTER